MTWLPTSITFHFRRGTGFGQTVETTLRALMDAGQFRFLRELSDDEREVMIVGITARVLEEYLQAGLESRGSGEGPDADWTLVMGGQEFRQLARSFIPHDRAQVAGILARLQLSNIHVANERELRERTRQNFLRKYPRTADTNAVDPDGSKFVLSLQQLMEAPRAPDTDLFSAFGCHGTIGALSMEAEGGVKDRTKQWFISKFKGFASKYQVKVGEEVVRWHFEQRGQGRRTFGFILGDNFYENGLQHTDDAYVNGMFALAYWLPYCVRFTGGGLFSAARPEWLDCKYLGALGNHDYNFHGHAAVPRDGGHFAVNFDRAQAQVDYTYRTDATLGYPHNWNMPHRYYAVVSPVAVYFVIDSSTFLFDRDQQTWLHDLHGRLGGTGRWTFLMAHHGYVTYGRRGAGHHAEKDVKGVVKTAHVKAAARAEAEGRTGADASSAAAMRLEGNVNKHIFDFMAGSGMHFDFNVCAHDHFSAAGMLTYVPENLERRQTYYVLGGGAGAYIGGGSLESLAAMGANCNFDLLEARYGFPTFEVTRDRVVMRFRLANDKWSWEEAFKREFTRDPSGTGFHVLTGSLTYRKRGQVVQKNAYEPRLRGVFLKRGAGGLLHSWDFQRRYFELDWEGREFRYGEKAGRAVNSVDLSTVNVVHQDAVQDVRFKEKHWKGLRSSYSSVANHRVIRFTCAGSSREWHFAVPIEQYDDFCLWFMASVQRHSPHFR